MDIHKPLALLSGMSPAQFMGRHWQKKPLLVRGAIPGFTPLLNRTELFRLASSDSAESRLIVKNSQGWRMKSGPFTPRGLPPLKQAGWTLLVQGVDGHDAAAHQLLQQFRFVPDARMDDLMISFATDQGGVGPHFDNYDVFLLQAHGKRRWRIGRQKDFTLQQGVPLKILTNFEPEEEFVLEPGDMLYLPPKWAHDGIAQGECMTYSIGFRSPKQDEMAREIFLRMSDAPDECPKDVVYKDPKQAAVSNPGEIPVQMYEFARQALAKALAEPLALERALGEYMSDPKQNVWFEPAQDFALLEGVRLNRRTRMLYDEKHIFINGESYLAAGKDAKLMQKLADERQLSHREVQQLSDDALELLSSWVDAGWADSVAK